MQNLQIREMHLQFRLKEKPCETRLSFGESHRKQVIFGRYKPMWPNTAPSLPLIHTRQFQLLYTETET